MEQGPSSDQILAQATRGIVATDNATRVTFINTVALKIDPKLDRIVGTPIGNTWPATGRLVRKALDTGRPQAGYQSLGKNSRLGVSVEAIHSPDAVIGTACTLWNAHEVESVAHALDLFDFMDRKFKTVFEASSDGMWICNGEGRVVEINQATEKLGGFERETIIGKKVSRLIEEGLYSNYVTDEVIRTKRHVSQLQKIRNTNKTVLCTGIPVLDKAGKVSLVVINERDITQLHAIREQLEEVRREKERYRDELAELSMQELDRENLVAENEKMQAVVKMAIKFAHLGVSDILLLGQSGTGKGLLAKLIHKSSKRRSKSFMQINCAAIPESILEAELFGYEKGAFTGARSEGKPGLLELAHDGTLFLDEIGEMPLSVQAKLLKYLDDHEVMRLGGTKTRKIDSIVIAATNKNIEKLAKEGTFRLDLYYRLNSLVIRIPPLKERPEDIFQLAHNFLNHFNRKYKLKKKINPLTIALLQSHPFPGNVRELRNIIKTAVFMSDGDSIDNRVISNIGKEVLEEWTQFTFQDPSINSLNDAVAAFEKEIVRSALKHCQSTRQLAKYLNISQPTVVRKLKRFGFSSK